MKLESKIKLYYLFKFLQNAHFFGAVLVPFYTIWAGMSEQTVLFIQSWFMLSVTLLELPTGLIADKFGRKISLVCGGVTAVVGLILYGLYANIYLFLLCEFILAIAITLYSGADEAWIVDTLIEHDAAKLKTAVIGKGQSFMFCGIIAGTILGSLVAQMISINATMYLSAIPASLLVYVALRMPEPKVHKTVDEVFRWKEGFYSLRYIISNKDLRYLSMNLIMVAVPAYFVLWLYQPLLQSLSINIAWFGVLHSLFVAVEVLVSHRFGWFEQKLGLSGYLKFSALLTAFGFLLLAWNLSLLTVVIFVFTAGSFGMTRRYFAIGHFHEFVDTTYRASISSSFSLLLRFSIAVANLFVGWLFVKSPSLTLFLLGLLPIIAVAAIPLHKAQPLPAQN